MNETKKPKIWSRRVSENETAWYVTICKKQFRLLTPYPGNENDAEAERDRLLIKLGKNIGPQKIEVIVSAFFDTVPESLKSRRARFMYLRDFSNYFCGQYPDKIDSDKIDEWFDSHPSWNSSSRYNVKGHISSFFKWGMKKKHIQSNPVTYSRKYHCGIRGEDIAISPENYRKLRSVANDLERDLIDVLYLSGARPSEILELDQFEYHPMDRTIGKIHHKNERHGHSRNIVCCNEVVEIIERRIQTAQNGLVFHSNGKKIRPDDLNKRIKALAKHAGITSRVISYSLRHGAAVRWLRDGVNFGVGVEQVSAWLGHSSIAVTQKHYSRLIELLKGSHARMNNLPPALSSTV